MIDLRQIRLIVAERTDTYRAFIANAVHEASDLPPFQFEEVGSIEAMQTACAVADIPYGLAICDLDLVGNHNCANLASLIRQFPLTSFIVYSSSDHLGIPQDAYAAGATGFFRRDSPAYLIVQVIGIVLGAEAFAIPDHFRFHHRSA